MRTPRRMTTRQATQTEMPVEVQVDAGLETAGVDLEQAVFHRLLDHLGKHLNDPRLSREVCVRLCDRAESQSLNAAYRGKDKPTNVLSFGVDVDVPEAPLGDLAICLPVVLEEATAQGKSADAHLTHLFLHGVLHLLGYDHISHAEAEEMEALEILVLADAGIANPYV